MWSVFLHLPTVALLSAIVASVAGVLDALLALRAKKRAHTAIVARAELYEAVRTISAKKKLTDIDREELRAFIEESGRILSETDRKRIRSGIRQSSRAGEERYMKELIAGR